MPRGMPQSQEQAEQQMKQKEYVLTTATSIIVHSNYVDPIPMPVIQ